MSTGGDAVTGWLRLPLGRLLVRLHLLVPVTAAVLVASGGDLWLRYLLLLATLLAHELAHAATSLALGAERASVSLWPVFGRADVENWRDRRVAWVALAGPALNLAAAAVLFFLGGRFTLNLAAAPHLDLLATVNLLMGAGNLLPVPPVDGGRALVAWRQGARASRS